jgi:PAS domain S-box-containing protein
LHIDVDGFRRSLIEASLDPLVTINAEGKITDVNKATEDVTGFSREQLIGSDFSEYFTDPEEAQKGYIRIGVLILLNKKPSHGYEIMKEIIGRFCLNL